MPTEPAGPSRAQVRPVIDLDLGHAHQFGYRSPEFIPSRPNEQWRFPSLDQTRTPAEETSR